MELIRPNTDLTLSLAFTDENDATVIPSAARYKIDDVESAAAVLAWTSFTPSTSSYDLVITAALNALINSALPIEKKLVTVEITYGTGKKKTDTCNYALNNISEAYMSAIDDLVDGVLPLEDSAKVAALQQAVIKFSSDRPREVIEEFNGTGTFDYELADMEAWLEGFSSIKKVEYPVDDTVQEESILQDDAWKIIKTSSGSYLRFLEDEPTASEEIRITYTGLHVCTNALCTIPKSDEIAVQTLAASKFCSMIAAYYAQSQDSTIGADSVDHKSKAQEYSARARAYKQEYYEHMNIKDGAVSAASITRDQDTKPSWRTDGLTHQRKFR